MEEKFDLEHTVVARISAYRAECQRCLWESERYDTPAEARSAGEIHEEKGCVR